MVVMGRLIWEMLEISFDKDFSRWQRESVPGVMHQLKPEGAIQVNGVVDGVPGGGAFQETGTSWADPREHIMVNSDTDPVFKMSQKYKGRCHLIQDLIWSFVLIKHDSQENLKSATTEWDSHFKDNGVPGGEECTRPAEMEKSTSWNHGLFLETQLCIKLPWLPGSLEKEQLWL